MYFKASNNSEREEWMEAFLRGEESCRPIIKCKLECLLLSLSPHVYTLQNLDITELLCQHSVEKLFKKSRQCNLASV